MTCSYMSNIWSSDLDSVSRKDFGLTSSFRYNEMTHHFIFAICSSTTIVSISSDSNFLRRLHGVPFLCKEVNHLPCCSFYPF